MTVVDGLFIGFFVGAIAGGWYASYFVKSLQKRGYAKFEVTEKFKEEIMKE